MLAFLSPFWRDILSLVGGIGVVLTAVGVWFAWRQLNKTAEATEAAAAAAGDASRRASDAYRRIVASGLSSLLSEAILLVDNEKWELARVRVKDLAESMQQLSGPSSEWATLIEDLHEIEGSFARVAKGELKFTAALQKKWQRIYQTLRAAARTLDPLPTQPTDRP